LKLVRSNKIMIDKFIKFQKTYQKGALLLELLIVIAILAVILSVVANAVFLSIRSNKAGGERDIASALVSEALEAVRAATEEDWQNIYGLTKSSQHYKTTISSGEWVLSTGDETITINGIAYTRYVVIDNVSRDGTTRLIQTSYSGTDDDPNTQKVTATVSWSGGSPVTSSLYLYRWKNKVCNQTAWTTAGSGNTVRTCPDTNYDTKDAAIDVTGGSLKLQ
jgi:type II secretory pathway pseudopilin PulG